MIKTLLVVGILVLVAMAYLYAIAPNENRDLDRFKGLMIAHRGLHEPGIPENSKAAFRNAVKNGYGVELDVQYTKDGRLVVFHDGNINRMCGVDKRVVDLTYEELLNYSLEGTMEKIPLFSEVLEILNGVPLVCEIKNHSGNKNDKLCSDTYELLKNYNGDYCIESFSPFLVKWFRDNHPEIVRGQLSCNLKNDKSVSKAVGFIMTQLLVNFVSRPDFIAYRHKDTGVLGYKVCSRLFRPLLIGWTARGEKEQKEAFKKFDSIIFELYENDNPVE